MKVFDKMQYILRAMSLPKGFSAQCVPMAIHRASEEDRDTPCVRVVMSFDAGLEAGAKRYAETQRYFSEYEIDRYRRSLQSVIQSVIDDGVDEIRRFVA